MRSKLWQDLHNGFPVQFEGGTLTKIPGTIDSGDTYLAERNTGPKLLTCHVVDGSCVYPREFPAYTFDIDECVKVGISL